MRRIRINWTLFGFFIFYFYVLQFVNDWQYRQYLDGGDFWATFRYRLFTTPFIMLAYYLFYKWGVPFLFKKKFVGFALAVTVFVVFLEIYSPLTDWIAVLLLSDLNVPAIYPKFSWQQYPLLHQSLHFTFINLFAISGFAYFLTTFEEERIKRQLKEQHLELELNYLKA